MRRWEPYEEDLGKVSRAHRRKRKVISIVLGIIVFAATLLAGLEWYNAEQNLRNSQRNESLYFAKQAEENLSAIDITSLHWAARASLAWLP